MWKNVSAGLTFFETKSLVCMLASPIFCEILKLILNFVWMKINFFPNHTAANCLFIISRFFKINFLVCLLIFGYTVLCIHKKYLFCIIQNFHLYFSSRLYFPITFPSIGKLAWICGINRKRKCILYESMCALYRCSPIIKEQRNVV